jgi:serine-type D-Ala-D-Ala carboxypeptidase (penicillin-binding protein 5/6)
MPGLIRSYCLEKKTIIKERFASSAILLALLFLGACLPANPKALATPRSPATPTAQPATATATQNCASTRTCTPTTIPIPSRKLPIATLEQPTLDLAAQSAVLIDAQTGIVLYAKQAHRRMFPASTTKMMTALLALEYFKPDETIRVGEEVNLAWTKYRLDAQKAGLYYGQELSMKELLYALLLPSGSDAAFVIAVNVARRESDNDFMPIDQALEHFTGLMNARAGAIGAFETNFNSPDGFSDPHHYSTAYDLALIAQQAMRDPIFRDIVSTPTIKIAEAAAAGCKFCRTWVNTNRLIDPQDAHYYAPANGIKTGTTTEAGYCLVSSAVFKQKMVIAVVLNSTQEGVWSDAVSLMDSATDSLP